MNTYKYFDMEIRQQTNIVKREYLNVYYWELDLSRPVACVMFDDHSCIDAACMLKLHVINPTHLKKLHGW